MTKWEWLKDKVVDAVMVVIFGGLAILIANGVLQSYLLPYELEKTAKEMRVKFEKDIADAEKQAIKREAELLSKADEARAELAKAIVELNGIKSSLPILPPMTSVQLENHKADWRKIENISKIDPDKVKLEYLDVQQKELDVRQSSKK